MSEELQPQAAGGVPDLVHNAATEVTSDDIALPRVKKGEPQSEHVQDGRAEWGDILLEQGSDDLAPLIIAKAGASNDGKTSEPVRFYVLAGPLKGWSYSAPGEDLQTWRFDDPDRHPDAWRTYKYVIALPDHEAELPATILFTRTSTPAARNLNTVLQKRAVQGPTDEVPFELSATKRTKDKYKFVVFSVREANVPEKDRAKDLEVVNALKSLVGSPASTPAEDPATQPAI